MRPGFVPIIPNSKETFVTVASHPHTFVSILFLTNDLFMSNVKLEAT